MAFRTIRLHLDGTKRDEVALDLALQLAAEECAHLTPLHVIHPFSPGLGVFDAAAAGAIAEFEYNYRVEAQAAADALLQTAEQRAQKLTFLSNGAWKRAWHTRSYRFTRAMRI